VLIWHIDESVIDANLADGTVNSDPEHRGVDLEEADGSQDIGRSYGFISAGSGSEDGTVLDFWYDGNSAPLRVARNVFDPVSNPNSLGYRFTNSHSSVSEFSARGPRMTARFSVGDTMVSPVAGFPKRTGSSFDRGGVTSGAGVLVSVSPGPEPRIYGWTPDGRPAFAARDSSGLIPFPLTVTGLDSLVPRAAVASLDGGPYPELVLAGQKGDSGRIFAFALNDGDVDALPDGLFDVAVPRLITTPPVISDSFIAVGTEKGFVYLLTRDGAMAGEFHVFTEDSSDVSSLALLGTDGGFIAGSATGFFGSVLAPICRTAGATGAEAQTSAGGLQVASGRFGPGTGGSDRSSTVLVSRDGLVNTLIWCDGPRPGFPVGTDGPVGGPPAIADLDGDGMKEIVLFSGRRIFALNEAGFPIDGFPVRVETDADLPGSPVVADLDGDGSMEVAGVSAEGVVFAYRRDGTMMKGFPLQAGASAGVTPAVYYLPGPCLGCAEIGLAVATSDGYLYAWKTGSVATGIGLPPEQPWPQFARDSRNTSSEDTVLTPAPPASEFFPASMAYNWPNPVGKEDGFVTHIRYRVATDATVTIRVFDLAGVLVTSFDGIAARGGLDSEVSWDASGVESGIYFAQVEASGAGGSGHAVIRIAVVK